ncbi:LGFP repeat-containing protein, partial [Klenkia brasiliensis]
MTRPATARRRAALWVAAALALVLLPLVAVGSPPAPRLAPAADGSQFSAGNIISDEIFFDGGSMTAPEVQAFLDLKGASCRTGSDGTPCLRVYRQDTVTKPADGRCATYAGAPMESAADIIAKVGAACGVNPRVLLVMMQKEQSLVTNSGSSLYATRYQKAMGFGCPDTAACDTQYYGFFNQVYNAARQFQNYRQRPTSYGYRAGLTNQIRFSPDASCGSAPVYLANQATAGLYNYTPYQPNAAALRAGYGSGDSCSAYGNRNFWMYYTDWFGSTQSPGGGAIAARYAVLGGSGGQLGAATSLITCGLAGGGCFQQYAGGAIHWSPATGAVETKGWVASEWASQSRENGPLGYPVAPEEPAVGGVLQRFQGGTVWSSPSSGAHAVWGWVLGKYTGLGGESSVLGFPTSDEVAVPGGV